MKKDKKWLVDKLTKERNNVYVHDPEYQYLSEFIAEVNQLDEPEVLSQEWIDEHKMYCLHSMQNGYFVSEELLQNLLVQKQELPVIPKFVAEWIETNREGYENKLFRIGYDLYSNAIRPDVDDWLIENEEKFVRAWLDGYEVENEPKYFARIKGHELMTHKHQVVYWSQKINDGTLGISTLGHAEVYKNKMTLQEWDDLGIDEYNADFVKIEEPE